MQKIYSSTLLILIFSSIYSNAFGANLKTYTLVGTNPDGTVYEGVAGVLLTNRGANITFVLNDNASYECSFTRYNLKLSVKECDYPSLEYMILGDESFIAGTWEDHTGAEILTQETPEIEVTFVSNGRSLSWNDQEFKEDLVLTYDWDMNSYENGCMNISANEVFYREKPTSQWTSFGDLRLCDGLGNYTHDIDSGAESKSPVSSIASVPLTKKNGVYNVPVTLNDTLTISFILDSGAADVTISPDVFLTLLRTGTLKESDLGSEKTYRVANGATVKHKSFLLKKVSIGGVSFKNIRASVGSDLKTPMLLGQSLLSKLGTYSINYETSELTFPKE